MSDKYKNLDLDALKATLEQKKLLLEANVPGTNSKELYRELKTLQYEISMRNAASVEASQVDNAPRISA